MSFLQLFYLSKVSFFFFLSLSHGQFVLVYPQSGVLYWRVNEWTVKAGFSLSPMDSLSLFTFKAGFSIAGRMDGLVRSKND